MGFSLFGDVIICTLILTVDIYGRRRDELLVEYLEVIIRRRDVIFSAMLAHFREDSVCDPHALIT